MAYVTPSTELEAVNAILATIGEAPVDTLDDSLTPLAVDVGTAANTLRSVNREVQAIGWTFNTEREYPLPRDINGFINVPSNCLHADPDGSDRWRDGVLRGTRLYDRINHTYVWDKDVTATIKLVLPFEELPQAARDYIAIRAGRRFQAGAVGSPTLHAFTTEDEGRALAFVQHEESDALDGNVLSADVDSFLAFVHRGGGTPPY